jgi:hypothetical protein
MFHYESKMEAASPAKLAVSLHLFEEAFLLPNDDLALHF